MNVRELQVLNFRNLGMVRAEFSPGINLIYGQNAQGKTNLLEALYLLVTGRSFRTTSERELIPWVRDTYEATVIRARVEKRLGEERCLFTFNQSEKHIFVNGKPIARLGELIGRINAVLFTPDDLQLVRGAPAGRRRFFDVELSQVSRSYLHHLQRYDLALRQRNSLLRQHQLRPNLKNDLQVWDAQLIENGTELTVSRYRTLNELSRVAGEKYRQIAGTTETLSLQYRASPALRDGGNAELSDVRELFVAALSRAMDEDIRRGATSVGPHRDDFDFLLSGHNAKDFGSQGQQRSCVLSLKLAELHYMQQTTREMPLLLLDDLMSELDESRRRSLLQNLDEGVQTFVTTTEKEPVLALVRPERTYLMENGQLSPA